MGLFRRRDHDEPDVEARIRQQVEQQVQQQVQQHVQHHVEERVRSEITALRGLVDEMRAELDGRASTDTVARLEERLRTIDERFSTPLTDPPPPPPPAPRPAQPVAPAATDAEVHALTNQISRLEERLTAVDRRITAVSTELANQIAELGSDVEDLSRAREDAETAATGDAAPAASVDPEVLEELRDAQLRLANEQARYQMAFREDLARLAEDLRRRAGR